MALSKLDKVREELICGICLDFLCEPKVLPCQQHSFCQQCLQKAAAADKLPDSHLQKDDFECPTCRQCFKLPVDKIIALPTNRHLKRLVDIVSEEEKEQVRSVILQQRKISQALCKLHSRPAGEHFCIDCNEFLCGKCISAHRGHDFQYVEDVLPAQRAALRCLIQPAPEVSSQAQSMIEHLVKEKDVVSKNRDTTTDAIRTFFNQMRDTLNEREKALLSTVEKYANTKLKHLDSQHQELKDDHDSITGIVGTVEKMFQQSEDVTLLLRKKEISEQFEEHQQSILSISKSRIESKEPASSSFLKFTEDFHLQPSISALGTLIECTHKPGAVFTEVRRVVVRHDVDGVYFEYPFSTDDSPQEVNPNIPPDADGPQDLYEEIEPDTPESPTLPKLPTQQPAPRPRPRKPRPPKPSPPIPPPQDTEYDSVTLLTPPANNEAAEQLEYVSLERSPLPSHPSQNLPLVKGGPDTEPTPAVTEVAESSKLPSDGSKEDQLDVDDQQEEYEQFYTPEPNVPTDLQDESMYEPTAIQEELYEELDPPSSKKQPTVFPRQQPPPPLPQRPQSPARHRRFAVDEATAYDISSRRHSFRETSIITPAMVIEADQLGSPNIYHENVYPCGVSSSHHGNIVITDARNHFVTLLDSSGNFLQRIGGEGSHPGEFKKPNAVAISNDQYIYVTEQENHRVQKFYTGGQHISRFGLGQKIPGLKQGGKLSEPGGIAVSPSGDVYVSDCDKKRVYVYNSDGRYSHSIGKEGFVQFNRPIGVAFDSIYPGGRLLVVDRGDHCVCSITPNGHFIGKLGVRHLYYPFGIAVGQDGSVIVTEGGNDRVSVFSSSGDLIRSFGQTGTEPGMFKHPRHVCVNAKGQIVVADENNQRLQVFDLQVILGT